MSLIYLDKPIGHELGWFNTGYDCARDRYDMFVLGYPGVLPLNCLCLV
jgi:hypothetical protein